MTNPVFNSLSTDVVIIGGGPVGLAAAANLSTHGVRTVIVESREYMQAPNVKCNHVSARTMESFRRLGLANKIRMAGLPGDHPHDVSFRTTVTGPEITRIPIPARQERFTSSVGPDTSWNTPEPPHRINQKYIEPIMMQHVGGMEHVTLLTQTRFVDFTQNDEGVVATAVDADNNQLSINAKYLIGADGGRSTVRKQIGAKLSGDPVLSHVQSTCIRSKEIYERMQAEKAWGYYTFNSRRNGHIYSIDGTETFIVHNYLSVEEAESGSVDRDWAIRNILGVDEDFEYEVVSNEDWIARRLVADKFREGRAFISGDACHLWVPYAGYGMNAGIADALNLSWLLAARINGWADEGILDAYEAERLPITSQVSKFAMSHLRKVTASEIPDNVEDETDAGQLSRDQLGELVYELNVQQFAAEGLNFGYSYDDSPIIIFDDEPAPEYSMGSYTPSTVPGCRAPHFWIRDGLSFYDELGKGYTLVVKSTDSSTTKLTTLAFARAGVPLSVLPIEPDLLPEEYVCKYTIVRQDQHVVWRGNQLPADTEYLIGKLRGNKSEQPATLKPSESTQAVFA